MAIVVIALGGILFWQYQQQKAGNEAQRLELANERYKDHNFEDAANRYRALLRDHPESSNRAFYHLAAELSVLREPVYQSQNDADEMSNAFLRLREFVAGYKGDPLLDRCQGDLWDTFVKVSGKLAEAAEENHGAGLAKLAEAALDQAAAFNAPENIAAQARVQEARERLSTVNQGIVLWQRKQEVIGQVKGVLDHFTFDGRQNALRAAQQAGLSADPEVARLLAELPAKHRASVTYRPAAPGQSAPLPPEDHEPTLLIMPIIKAATGEPAARAPVLLAATPGVLYALDPSRGAVRWYTRINIDAPELPVRIARTAIAPELVLALTPDSDTLTALDAERGTPVWRHRLKGACLGSPVLVENRVFVATDQGDIEEIETTEGTARGYYSLGQPLTVGGVHQHGTNLVYFPADSETVYVLDVAARTCAGILYTGHPAGSLRGSPVILQEPAQAGNRKPAARACLVLSQEDGLDEVKLRVFPLPGEDPGHGARAWEKKLPGWSWFPPYVDSERLAQVTDSGHVALFGFGARTRDRLGLFPLVRDNILLGSGGTGSGRAQIVHADTERFWVLADGDLHKLVQTFDRQEGPRVVQRTVTEALGLALHAAQARVDRDGNTTLFVVTRARDRQTCLASALDGRSGSLAWQRQLGLPCRGQPLRLGNEMLVEDQDGALYLFGAGELKGKSAASWHLAGRKLPGARPSGPGLSHFLPTVDGASVFVVTSLATQPPSVMVQVFRAGNDTPSTSTFPLQAGLAGTPGLGKDALVLPLGNGVLVRQALAGGPAVSGPNWRAEYAEVEMVGHVIPLGKDEFLVTDGSRGLKRLTWPSGSMAETKAAVELPNRIIAAPQVLAPARVRGDARVCVADASNTVTLLQGDGLQPARQWPMGGKITAGPFVRGQGVGCIVDSRRLVWLDPEKAGIAWEYVFAADVVGEPQRVSDNLFIVADLSGHFAGFDPATGRMEGLGYTLRANVAPAAAPVSCGAGRLFAPLTDDTVLLLSLSHFQHPLRGMPSIW